MTNGRECPEWCKADLPLRAAISEINRRSNDIAVPSFILSGAPLWNTISPLNAADFALVRSARGVVLQVQIDVPEVEVRRGLS
jgi:poly-beta-hydroxyalkanoate depolymerase